jgi:2-phospho-L-lactate/phosphoenolpyruvate guanylyltransferase
MFGMNLVRAADLSRLVAIVPVRSFESAKSRLGEPLDAEERQSLVGGLLDRTIRAASGVEAIESVVVVSPDQAVLKAATAAGATPVRQADDGLNEGIRAAARWAMADGATAVVVLAADLPAISVAEIESVVTAAGAASRSDRALVAIVADRHGRGTNVLLVSPPDAVSFRFGPGSRAAHLAGAGAANAVALELDGPLALDLDLPEDLILADELGLLDPARVG